MYANVSFPISSYQSFTYSVPEPLKKSVNVGVRVRVPFGSRKSVQGVITQLKTKVDYKGKILSITSLVDDTPVFDEVLWKLLGWVSNYYFTPIGQVAKTALPSSFSSNNYTLPVCLYAKAEKITKNDLKQLRERAEQQFLVYTTLQKMGESVPVSSLNNLVKNPHGIIKPLKKKGYISLSKVPIKPDFNSLGIKSSKIIVTFSKEQKEVISELKSNLGKNKFSPYLFRGVTGSGKTEIYIALAKHAEEMGLTSIILLPEISLTPQIAGRFQSVFSERVAIWHSRMTTTERQVTWQKICLKEYSIVIGARSAIFAPLKNVGLIIVDEEQESSFKQDSPAPRYHARDVALMRGKLNKSLTILASATPSMESYYNQIIKKLNYIELKKRYGGAKYPKVHLVDMNLERAETENYKILFSRLLLEKIEDCLERNEQIILLQNRRGFSPYINCRDCGNVEYCKQCQISLTFHKTENKLMCHYCSSDYPVPTICYGCGSNQIVLSGAGTQKIEDELREALPQIKVKRMDIDSVRKRGDTVKTLEAFKKGEYDVLVGTQMIAKGLDFPNVTLVGVINADLGLFLPDFRAGERTFQLIYQVAGRSGRGKKPGEVIIQTNNPDNTVIIRASKLDMQKYYNICLSERKELMYPPFSWIVKLNFSGKDKKEVEKSAKNVLKKLNNIPKQFRLFGPAPCPIEKLRGQCRYHIIVSSPKNKDKNGEKLHTFLRNKLIKEKILTKRKGVSVVVDVDPASLL